MANPEAFDLSLTRIVEAPPERVFDAWLSTRWGEWVGPAGIWGEVTMLEPHVGGRYRIVMHQPTGNTLTVGGVYREIDRPRRLVFSWMWEHEKVDTLVTLSFRAVDGKTELTLKHEGFQSAERRDGHQHGWTGTLEKLAARFAGARVVPLAEWLDARKALLAHEKEFTRARDSLSAARRALPWVKVEKDYAFDGPKGRVPFGELFGGCGQLIVYHFMFHPDWTEGCKSCSFWADNYNGVAVHLNHRDTGLVAVSRAPYAKLAAYEARMGWSFPWYSSQDSDFNYDFGVSFRKGSAGQNYNFGTAAFGGEEAPGVSVFARDSAGSIFHTYSTYARGLDMLNGAYHLLDLTPKGRDEDALDYPMAWVRRHDQY